MGSRIFKNVKEWEKGKGGRLLVWFCMILREIGGELEYKLGMILLLISGMMVFGRWYIQIDEQMALILRSRVSECQIAN